ncbi:thiopurine S-methyltransferase [Legionella sp. km772]|uniref:thiopurine S-methyltransferase n=1 Tax=Legionella sp. km772 TaxID=2498111 RepID=UPI000F8D8599|nr:thiopurine S-methyltransferase [Legionella sp. km772]RUR13819.1 thiopurine S-methyltransferase [Legionella sp. km772]
MNKGKQFWLDSWQEGRIPFHRAQVNPDLVTYWPALKVRPNSKILVPLCGKSLDLLWFIQQGYQVIGIELSETAVLQFFKENNLAFSSDTSLGLPRFTSKHLSIWVGDIFSMDLEFFSSVDAIYDRAALIALPQALRPSYVDLCWQWLKPQGSIFLKTLSYNPELFSGPPYSVPALEVASLYKSASLHCLKTTLRDNDERSVINQGQPISIEEKVWQLVKK